MILKKLAVLVACLAVAFAPLGAAAHEGHAHGAKASKAKAIKKNNQPVRSQARPKQRQSLVHFVVRRRAVSMVPSLRCKCVRRQSR